MARALRWPCVAALGVSLLAMHAADSATAASLACRAGSRLATGSKAYLVDYKGTLVGCVRGARRSVPLANGDEYSLEAWQKPRLAGTFAAYESEGTHKCTTVDIRVVNLRTRRVREFSAGSSYAWNIPENNCLSYGEKTTDMALRSDGAIAFIAGGTEVVRGAGRGKYERHKIVSLESSPLVAPQSLGLTRAGLMTWWSAGQMRSAVLPAAPRWPST